MPGVSASNVNEMQKTGKEDIDMATWVIMLGVEAVFVIGSIIAIAVWMKRGGGEEDALDRRLAELSEMSKAREAAERN